jgi:hypothetical protein
MVVKKKDKREILFEDGEEQCFLTISLTKRGVEITCQTSNGNEYGCVFSGEELMELSERIRGERQ